MTDNTLETVLRRDRHHCGFSLWFGKRRTVSAELRALVEADLTRA